jgi:hypothetical protein
MSQEQSQPLSKSEQALWEGALADMSDFTRIAVPVYDVLSGWSELYDAVIPHAGTTLPISEADQESAREFVGSMMSMGAHEKEAMLAELTYEEGPDGLLVFLPLISADRSGSH